MYDFSELSKTGKCIETERKLVVARGQGEGEMGIRTPLWVIKMFWN